MKEYLLLEGVRRSLVNQYLFEAGEVSIGKTYDKSVIGTMTEMSLYSRNTEFNHTFDLSGWLNSMIFKPINYEEPIKVFKKSLEENY